MKAEKSEIERFIEPLDIVRYNIIVNKFKGQAIKLRKQGYSYAMIKEKLGVSKSTLSNWLIDIPFVPNKELIAKMGKAKLKSALFNTQKKHDDIEKMHKMAEEEVGNLSDRDIFMLGIGLYIGEGSKSQEEVKMVNGDPYVLKIIIQWLKKNLGISNENLKMRLHLYPENNTTEALQFWSNETNIPHSQFVKPIIDTRANKSEFRKGRLPYGTGHLYIKNGGTIRPGVKSLHRRIMGWIKAVKKQVT